jgi:lipopolysaccharide transport system ATP-binding protein
MQPIIKVEHISKRYQIGAREEGYKTLREAIVSAARSPFKHLGKHFRSADDDVWALNDVSFNVQPGEVVGIIGRNGAGKSTLLKILSRITKPTSGAVDLYGRVGSLLEVGTGFHQELTGRENIFLNGAILGMAKSEIIKKFDDIVEFAEIDRFLDTPVKRYSSGMYVRLAFAVAAHLEPEILIVDEVLAVGDASFQQKCLGKMSAVAREGRTVLFVSHNMPAVKSLCERALLLSNGCLVQDGKVDDVVNSYLTADSDEIARTGIIPHDAPRLYGTDEAKLRALRLTDLTGVDVSQLYLGQPFLVQMTFEVFKEIPDAVVELDVVAMDGTLVTHSSNIDGGEPTRKLEAGFHTISLELHTVLLPRQYTFLVGLHHSSGTTIEWIERALDFTVLRVAETGTDSYRWASVRGYVRPSGRWVITPTYSPDDVNTLNPSEDLVLGGHK